MDGRIWISCDYLHVKKNKFETKQTVSIKISTNFNCGRDSIYSLLDKKIQRKMLQEAHD